MTQLNERYLISFPDGSDIILTLNSLGKLATYDSDPEYGGWVIVFQSVQEAIDYGCTLAKL